MRIRILAQVPEAELVVAGGPPAADLDRDPDVARLRALARQLEVGDRVSFLGAVPRADRPALIRSADVVVCLPQYELSVRVVLEAMACGRPVVAAASGGLLDVVDDGVTGLLVEPQAPSAGALAVRRLLAAPGLRHAMSESARSRAEGEFDWRRVAQAVEEVYLAMRPARRVLAGWPVCTSDVGVGAAAVALPVSRRSGVVHLTIAEANLKGNGELDRGGDGLDQATCRAERD